MKTGKIDSKQLLKMFKQGKMQKDIAKHFGCSPVAVCKRLKRLIPQPVDVLDKYNLTDQQKCFVIEKAKGKTNTQAVMASYEVTTLNSAKVQGSQLMNKPNIQLAINELLELGGHGRHYRVKKLGFHMENADPVISLKALDMGFKLAGDDQAAKTPPSERSYIKIDIPCDRPLDITEDIET